MADNEYRDVEPLKWEINRDAPVMISLGIAYCEDNGCHGLVRLRHEGQQIIKTGHTCFKTQNEALEDADEILLLLRILFMCRGIDVGEPSNVRSEQSTGWFSSN